jgi:pimeloyl-ACP methyl ester carboxylesterase
MARTLAGTLLLLAAAALARAQAVPATDADGERAAELAKALRAYFDAPNADGPELAACTRLATGHEPLLTAALRSKSFVVQAGTVARKGYLDADYRFVDDPDAANAALFAGPAGDGRLHPCIVYVPDATDTQGFPGVIARDGAGRGWFVYLVPDERRDNRYAPTLHEHRRHVQPLRQLLLEHPIDPDRVSMIGSGRGGHATWDIGLLHPDRFAALVPCNGGLIHEGGWKQSGGVFLENARCLQVFTVFNTTFDHGIESCRYAAKRFREWQYRAEFVEEQQMRQMGIPEATDRLGAVVRDAHPRAIQKRFNHLEEGSHYWLQALDRPKPWDPTSTILIRGEWPKERDQQLELVWSKVREQCALLRGKVQGNRVEVEARGTGRVRVWFDPELVDFGAKVTVVLNGKVLAPRALRRRVDVLLRAVHETGDTSRLYWDFVDLRVP